MHQTITEIWRYVTEGCWGVQNSHHFRVFVSESVKQHRQQLEANQHVQVLYYEKKLERMVENMVHY